jgi:MarR family transcriptional regulator for hemolysin
MKTAPDSNSDVQSLALALHDAARLLKSEFERRARQTRLSLMQWRALAKLAREDGLTQAALAARIEASPMTMSDILDRLERLGYVRREPDPSDSRAKLVWITPAAAPIVAEMRALAAEVYDLALAGISTEDRHKLLEGLRRIGANLETADKG